MLSRPNVIHLLQTNPDGLLDIRDMQSNDVFYSNIKNTIKKYIEGGLHKGKPNRETQMILDSFHLTDKDILSKFRALTTLALKY